MILLVSLLYSCIDLWCEWDGFASCVRPIHRWLLVSYGCVIAFRVAHLLGSQPTSTVEGPAATSSTNVAADFLLDLRQKDGLRRILAGFTWIVALPFFVFWTLLGTFWLYEVATKSPTCVPSATHLWFCLLWLVLCYIWILVHLALGTVAWLLERRVRRAEIDLRQLEDSDTVSRWGEVSRISGYTALENKPDAGLTPAEIRALPGVSTMFEGYADLLGEENECPICITCFKDGDTLRTLKVCGHSFHRSCIDLWLLRRADCPLCKQGVKETEISV
eukprot:TRINITY_DN730_c0_g1_i1.p1 TRINITY_DN730_c0_g1~~TRINITY_DN730_c0_g1_i1.p1  ORF type:complete len:318 (-),score=45.23 TRINITY_DN730_c0_g1_i1:83-910(-)